MRIWITIGLVLAFLSGCKVHYRPSEPWWRSGYSELELASDVYQVSFHKGLGNVGPGQLPDLALLRSAELTLEKGYRYFMVRGRAADRSTDDDAIFTIKMFGTKPKFIVYSAVAVQRQMRSRYGLKPIP